MVATLLSITNVDPQLPQSIDLHAFHADRYKAHTRFMVSKALL